MTLVALAILVVAAANLFNLIAQPPAQVLPEVLAPSSQPEGLETPFEDARMQQARLDAQNLLAQIFARLNQLETMRVADWAGDELLSLQQQNKTGDDFYQQRRFDDAIGQWQDAIEGLEALVQKAPEIAQSLYIQARSDLASAATDSALRNLDLALAIDPANRDFIALRNQALVREQVIELTSSVRAALGESRLDEAAELLQQASKLDAQYPDISALQTALAVQTREANLLRLMSEGYSALAAANFAQAERSFSAAAALDPDSDLVQDALVQLDSAKLGSALEVALLQAQLAEDNEDWSAALSHWQEIAELSHSSADSRIALIRVQARLALENRILAVLADPLALRDNSRWQAAESTLQEARAIRDAGPALTAQIEDLANAIRQARTLVVVTLKSDGLTQVRIPGVADLGKFREFPLELYPGRYTLVGEKSGYQDLRQDVTLDGSQVEITFEVIPERRIDQL